MPPSKKRKSTELMPSSKVLLMIQVRYLKNISKDQVAEYEAPLGGPLVVDWVSLSASHDICTHS